ncbi:MAG: CoA pyrophosphatase [Ekhidna sp.]|nr:CoA pyrophosphatase [Ekhidna sp.]MBC6409769.1 CoA pyrophosphatase [Ekhidna sp.]MBC6426870.1 CoA pyrophosphatase [Ekhidna sp.]
MDFDRVTNFLEKRLQGSLPGAGAHELMKPVKADGTNFSIKHPVSPRESGVLILFHESEGDIRFPLIQRPAYKGVHSGQMALPGGKKETEDGDLFDTALREAKEEIGVDHLQVEILGSLSKFYVMASNYEVLPVIGKVKSKSNFTPDNHEVESIINARLSHLVNPNYMKEKRILVRGEVEMICPYFDLEDKIIWGATAMILSELVVILQEYRERSL